MFKTALQISAIIIFALMSSSCAAGKTSAYAERHYEEASSAKSEQYTNGGRMIAYTVSLVLTVKNTDDTKKQILDQIKGNKGFVIAETQDRITTRIPAENMDGFLKSVRRLGEIYHESKEGTDITDQYRDNTLRLNTLKSVRDRYLALLEKAEVVSDILSIEKELERVNLEIEGLEGRIKYAEQSVAYSSITVRLRTESPPVKPVRPGPVGWVFYGLYHGVKWLLVWD
jgi:hypothetical protein